MILVFLFEVHGSQYSTTGHLIDLIPHTSGLITSHVNRHVGIRPRAFHYGGRSVHNNTARGPCHLANSPHLHNIKKKKLSRTAHRMGRVYHTPNYSCKSEESIATTETSRNEWRWRCYVLRGGATYCEHLK